jgi:hypothetical protein
MSVTGQQVANEAKKLKPGIFGLGTIPYVLGAEDPKTGLDCQGLVEYCHRQCGMKMSYKGTNDMWRNMGSDKGTIADGVAKHKKIPLGAAIFIVDHDGKEGAAYQGDGQGNAWHVYIKVDEKTLVHASESNGMVTTRSFADKAINGGPSHYMLIDGVDYGSGNTGNTDSAPATPAPKRWKPIYTDMVFKIGGMGNGTREIQTGLNLCGADPPLNIDGEFGKLTENAVIDFQKKHGLQVDGVVGRATWAKLIEFANA